jgi:hypothetical protein
LTETVSVLANKICEIMSAVNIDSYDLSCFISDDCQSVSWEQLFQLMIDKVCFFENSTTENPASSEEDCPEDLVVVADCFDGTAETYTDYVKIIGIELCSLTSLVSSTLADIEAQSTRLDDLEGASSDCVTPQITPTCLGPSVPTDIDIVIGNLEVTFCEYQSALGSVSDLTNAINTQCIGLSTSDALNAPGTMGQISGWNQNPTSVADSLSNLWLTLCDMRGAMEDLQACCAENN